MEDCRSSPITLVGISWCSFSSGMMMNSESSTIKGNASLMGMGMFMKMPGKDT